jgi:DNA-binding response OmpR family regulator
LSSNISYEGAQPVASDRPRRALIVVDAAAATLQKYLAAYGYETLTTTTDAAQRAILEFAPDVAIIELHRGGIRGEDASIALARHLRAEPATYSLPLVFVWAEDERAVRSAAIYVGADDYFALSTPSAEILARLDALFWRVEADRRAAPVAGDQRLEIDNFMLLLDSVRDHIRAGTAGTLGLIYAVAPDGDKALEKAARDHTLAQAHSFFKLNLRRIDAIAFYGPTTLLVYLPRTGSVAAIESLSKLREEFLNDCQGCDVAIGLASFPDDGSEVERMIEKAEAAVAYARAGHRADRIMTYEASQMSPRPAPKRDFIFESQQAETTTTEIDQTADTTEPDRATARQIETAGEPEEQRSPVPFATAPSASAHRQGAMQMDGSDSARLASEAAAHERERRAKGAIMPRRLLLTVSDATRMTQLNSLVRAAGYEARAAFDGQQALDLLRIERPDLLLLDYELNGINGVETLRRLRKQGGGKIALPIVMLLPSEMEEARREALELGAASVITTPYDPASLLESVRVAGHAE